MQLLVWGDRTARDRRGVLAEVAACGYAGVEMGPPDDVDAALADLRAYGLRLAASHAITATLERDLDRHLRWLERGGAGLLACSGSDYPTSAQYREVAQRLDRAGARCRSAGVTFCYHHHAHEIHHDLFGLGYLLRYTDPVNVRLNLDTYWIARGGQDPPALIRLLGDRVAYLHLKDMAADGSFAEVGAGRLDWEAIRQAVLAVDPPWCIVEQDSTRRTPLESSRMSREFLRAHWGV